MKKRPNDFRIPTDEAVNALLSRLNSKYQLIVLLMVDAGLRVMEVVRLQVKHFNAPEKVVGVVNAKGLSRTIPLTYRVLEALGAYWLTLKDKSADAFLFPSSGQSLQQHLSRKMVYRRIIKHSDGQIQPNMLRHYFAARVVNNGNDLQTAQQLLGHASQQSTEVYLQVSEEKVQAAIHSLQPRPAFMERIWKFWAAAPPISVTPVQLGMTDFHIGRIEEMETLYDLHDKRVNVLILGPQGIGKSHLLDNFQKGKIIRVDDFRYPKGVLGGLLLTLFDQDKEAILSMLLDLDSKDQLQRVASKESTKRLCELAMQVTRPQEYTLVIDDLTDVTKLGVRILEKLKNHFHIIAAARRIKMELATFLTNFEKMELAPLSRAETTELINRLSQTFLDRIEDYEAYKNRICEDTQGIPLFVIEMIDRMSKEQLISLETMEQIKHTASRAEIDFSVPLVVALSSLLVLRYLGSELGQNAGAFRLIGGVALVIAFFSRRIFRALKRKFV